jgi:hypothetical protein
MLRKSLLRGNEVLAALFKFRQKAEGLAVKANVVLVVEDEPLIRMLAVEMLADAGRSVVEFATADEASVFRASFQNHGMRKAYQTDPRWSHESQQFLRSERNGWAQRPEATGL